MKVTVETSFGIVNFSSTALLHGEGPNVYSYRWARAEDSQPLTKQEFIAQYGDIAYSKLEAWAEGEAWAGNCY